MRDVLIYSNYETDINYIREFCQNNAIPYVDINVISGFIIKFKKVSDVFEFTVNSLNYLSKCLGVSSNRYKFVPGISDNHTYCLELIDSWDF